MKMIQIKQVDVFTTIPFGGNPAGVATDAMGLSTDEMQGSAREMNLSETAFVFPPNKKEARLIVMKPCFFLFARKYDAP
jgi:trans-2,3-dihydro-3-hydroxyanthranilate isomerase